jgi:hypothetical protein
VGIFLTAVNEAEPSVSAEAQSNSQAILVEGDTEEGVEPATEDAKKKQEENPLKVNYVNGLLNVRVRNMPLSVVLMRIGSVLGVPVEIKDDTKDLITTEIVGLPVEDALQKLSLYIRMYVRADLQRMERRVLRLVLIAPPGIGQPAPSGAGQTAPPVKP